MRTETFHEEHDVALTDEDRNIRGRQAARGALALKKHDELVETRAEEWRTLKKQLAGEREQKLETLRAVSVAAETGIEPRQVLCDEVLVGAMVITRRLDMDPPADVSSRPASQDELKGIDRDNHPKAPPKLHAVPSPAAPVVDLGVELRAKLIELVTVKPRSETLARKALAVRVSEVQPDSKPKQREKAADEAVKQALADGAIVRNDTGLLCLPVAAALPDDEIPFGDPPGYDATDEHAGDAAAAQ